MNRLGHLGYALLWSGQALIALEEPAGWLVRLTGEAIWLGIGIRLNMNSIWLWGMIGIAVEIFGFLSWKGMI